MVRVKPGSCSISRMFNRSCCDITSTLWQPDSGQQKRNVGATNRMAGLRRSRKCFGEFVERRCRNLYSVKGTAEPSKMQIGFFNHEEHEGNRSSKFQVPKLWQKRKRDSRKQESRNPLIRRSHCRLLLKTEH